MHDFEKKFSNFYGTSFERSKLQNFIELGHKLFLFNLVSFGLVSNFKQHLCPKMSPI